MAAKAIAKTAAKAVAITYSFLVERKSWFGAVTSAGAGAIVTTFPDRG